MSGDRPKYISMPTSFSQGVARADMKTWGVLSIVLAIAIAVVVLFNMTYEKKPMFGDAPFGQAKPQQPQERVVPVARPGEMPPRPRAPAPSDYRPRLKQPAPQPERSPSQ